MSRLKRFTHSLVSGYVVLAANLAFTLASVPLALHYLSTAAFGLWAFTSQAAGFIALIDLGMAGSVSRILVDYKDDRTSGHYGSVVQTGMLVNCVQGALVLLVSVAVAVVPAGVFGIEPDLAHDFRWLMMGQGMLMAGTFAARILVHLLAAHQRYDVANGAQALSFAVNFGAVWMGFTAGGGVFSILWGQAAGLAAGTLITAAGCARLRLFPAAGQRRAATWRRFRELFALGRDVFLFTAGAQLIFASQTILITKMLGLETGAVWSICTRTVTLAMQVIYRVFDFSCPALAEMLVRGERERLFARFRSIVTLSTSMGLLAGVSLLICNSAFVGWWTAGRIQWPAGNDALLALWLVLCVVSHPHIGLVGQTKNFRFLRWVYFLEGLLFVGLAVLTMRRGGLTAMLVSSVAASLVCSFPYALWRTRQYFGLNWRELLWEWSRPGLIVAALVAPVAAAAWWLSRPWSPGARLLVCALTVGGAGGALLLRVGLEPRLRRELRERVPVTLRPMVGRLLGRG